LLGIIGQYSPSQLVALLARATFLRPLNNPLAYLAIFLLLSVDLYEASASQGVHSILHVFSAGAELSG